jgi:hypothetical protein
VAHPVRGSEVAQTLVLGARGNDRPQVGREFGPVLRWHHTRAPGRTV